MDLRKGLAPIVIILVVVALLGAGVGGFVFISKEKGIDTSEKKEQELIPEENSKAASSKRSSPPVKGLSLEDLQGYWQPRQQFVWDSSIGELSEIPIRSENAATFLEFRNSEICVGQFDESGMPKPCATSFPFILRGSMIVAEGSGFPPVEAELRNSGQELILENPADESVIVLGKATVPLQQGIASSPVQQTQTIGALAGIWKIERAFSKELSGYRESKELAKNVGYQEFKANGTMCRLWTVDYVCNGYEPYTAIAENKIKAEVSYGGGYDVFIWKITGGKLELIGDTWKGIYVKVNAIEGPIVNSDPLTSPKLESITVSAYSIPVGGDVTITCKASDNTEVSWIDFSIVGPKVQQGWRYNPETKFNKALTASYTYTVPDSGTYKISCHTFDNEENEATSQTISVSAS